MRNKHLSTFISRTIATAGLVMAILCAINVKAQTPMYIWPGASPTYTGGANSWPLSAGTLGGSYMCQWLYLNSEFTTPLPPGGILITTIYIKPASGGTYSYTGLSIKLGNSALTTMTTGPWYTGLTTVYSPATVSLTGTANAWLAFTLPTPFFYSGGGLLLEITHNTSINVGGGFTLNQYSVVGRNGRMYGSPSTTGTADVATAVFGFDAIPAACSGTPVAGTITTPAMNPISPVCAGGTFSVTGTDPNVGNGLVYSWQSGLSAAGPFSNVTSGTGATTLNYTTGPLPTTTWFRLGITCTNSSITTYSAPFQVLVGAPQPSVITGSPTFCPGDPQTYSVTNVAGSTYTWTLPATWTGTSTTNSILTVQGTSGGVISVTATSPCGPSVARTATIVPGSAPAAPAAINGNTSVCASSTQTYTVAPVPGASSYAWTLPGGWTGSSTSNSITVITGSSAASGTLQAKAVNGCGSSVNTNLAINVINSLPNPGTITSSLGTGTTYCTGALYSFSIVPVPGATSYVWTMPSASWTGTVTGTSIQAFAGSAGGQLKVTAYASCATSGTSVLNTTVAQTVIPTVTISAPATALCQGVASTFTATPINGGTSPTYIWKKNNVVVYGSNNTYTDANLSNGDQIAVVMVSSALCRSADSIYSGAISANITPLTTPGISINSTPVITICQGTPLNLTTTITGGGTNPTYQWFVNNVPMGTASTYSFSNANNKDTVTVQMTTTVVCPKFPVASSNKVGILVNPTVSPTITVTASSVNPAPGIPITFTATQSGGGATPVYQWILNSVDIPGEINPTYTTSDLKTGDHVTVRMQSYDPCAQPGVVVAKEVILEDPAGIGTIGWEGGVSLYPNPTGGRFTISAAWSGVHAQGKVNVDVLSVLGQRIYHGEAEPGKGMQTGGQWHYEVEMGQSVSAGHYMVRLSTANGMTATLPLTITR